MGDHVEQIKSRLDIVDVISGYLKVQKSGVNHKARCPFHNEKTASFYISPERQIWHCFGCSKGGDMFGFIKEIEGVEFPEALRILAAKAGVELQSYNPKERDEKTELFQICELAGKFFEKQLESSNTGKKAFEYLKERGLTVETIKEFRLGFAPNDWQSLTNFLTERGYSGRKISEAGLAIAKDNRYYDRFRSRITFPILEANGQVVGFTGRIFGMPDKPVDGREAPAKYINTPQTAIYDKSHVLYGLSASKTEIRKENKCLLVEGNMDAIMSYQAGAKNVVATSGTALTPTHLKMLQRYTQNLEFCFDTDQAGALATRRGIGLALSQNFNIKVVTIDDKECKDPADYVKKYGEGWVKAVEKSQPVLDYYFSRAKEKYDPASAESKKSVIASLAPLLRRLASRVEYSHWVSTLAGFLRVEPDAISADVAMVKDDLAVYEDTGAQIPTAQVAGPEPARTADKLSETFLSVILHKPSLFKEELAGLDCGLLHPEAAVVIEKIRSVGPDTVKMDDLINEEKTMTLEFAYLRSQEDWRELSEPELKMEYAGLLNKLKTRIVSARLTSLEADIRQAESGGDKLRLTELMKEFTVQTALLSQLQIPPPANDSPAGVKST